MSAEAESTFDVVILGGGSGGYACALRAAELGLSVALVEKGKLGGTCLHLGCIPTKALLHAAEVADSAREGEQFGVKTTFESVDMTGVNALQGRRRRPALQGPAGPGEVPPDRLRRGRGPARRPPTPSRSPVAGSSGATSCWPPAPTPRSLPGLEIAGRIMTSEQALSLDSVPPRVVVLGGGVIGVEFASVFKSFGSEVTIVEALPRLVPPRTRPSPSSSSARFRKRKIALQDRRPLRRRRASRATS